MAWEMSRGIKNVFSCHDLNRYETRKFPTFPLLNLLLLLRLKICGLPKTPGASAVFPCPAWNGSPRLLGNECEPETANDIQGRARDQSRGARDRSQAKPNDRPINSRDHGVLAALDVVCPRRKKPYRIIRTLPTPCQTSQNAGVDPGKQRPPPFKRPKVIITSMIVLPLLIGLTAFSRRGRGHARAPTMPRSAWTPIPGHILHGHADSIQTGGGGALWPSSSGEFHREFR
jgi:hypothetical protein